MTDETKDAAAADQPVDAAVVAVGDDLGVDAVAGIAVQGNQALVVAQFADMDSAKNAYYALVDAEAKRAIDIDGVLVVNADYQGKVNIQKMTDHKTRTGFVWGAVAGAAIGLIFPPTILAGAVYAGVAGAAIGKARNVMMKSGVAEELAGVIAPGTSGIVALVSVTAVDAVKADHPRRQGRQVGSGRRRDRGGRQGRRQGCRRLVGRLSSPRSARRSAQRRGRDGFDGAIPPLLCQFRIPASPRSTADPGAHRSGRPWAALGFYDSVPVAIDYATGTRSPSRPPRAWLGWPPGEEGRLAVASGGAPGGPTRRPSPSSARRLAS